MDLLRSSPEGEILSQMEPILSHDALAKRPNDSYDFNFTSKPIVVNDLDKPARDLQRFARYLAKMVEDNLDDISYLMGQHSLLRNQVNEPIEVRIELIDDARGAVFTLNNGTWQQRRGEPRKEAVLKVHITVGPFYLHQLNQQCAANVEHAPPPNHYPSEPMAWFFCRRDKSRE